MLSTLAKCLRLNARMAGLAGRGKWLEPKHFADSYDRTAPTYDRNWLVFLKPVTDALIDHLPSLAPSHIIDLGCGTGYCTEQLATRYPAAEVVGVDLSPGMLRLAQEKKLPGNVRLHCADMLTFVQTRPSCSSDLVVSAWAIGYSRPAAIVRSVYRILKPGGFFALVVNMADTLRPIFRAYRQTMLEFPESPRLALWPRFPKDDRFLGRDFLARWCHEGRQAIVPAGQAAGKDLSWLLGTGVLAGFDQVLPLHGQSDLADYFWGQIVADGSAIEHHYLAAMLEKP